MHCNLPKVSSDHSTDLVYYQTLLHWLLPNSLWEAQEDLQLQRGNGAHEWQHFIMLNQKYYVVIKCSGKSVCGRALLSSFIAVAIL